jgi:putative peptidoglycan lipid II flippase
MVRDAAQAADFQATAVVPTVPGVSTPESKSPLVINERTKAQQSPQRMLVVTGILIAVVVLALIIGLITVFNRKHDTAAGTSTAGTSATGSKAGGKVYPIAGGKDFDPTADGGNGEENPAQVALAYDGKTDTAWTTLVYKGSAKLGGLKKGVGYIVDLGQPVSVGTVSLVLVGQPTAVELRVPSGDSATVTAPPMTNAAQWTIVATNGAAGTSVDLSPSKAVTTQFVMIYITSLPAATGGYKAGIAEVTVKA